MVSNRNLAITIGNLGFFLIGLLGLLLNEPLMIVSTMVLNEILIFGAMYG
jgi:hypothetical protein